MSVAGDPELKILLVIESTSGGSARHVIDLAEGLLAQGHVVHVVYSSVRADAWFVNELKALDGIVTYVVDMTRNPGPKDLVSARKLRKIMREQGPFDIVHGHSAKAGALIRLSGIGLPGRKVYTPHAFITLDPELGWKKRAVFTLAERQLERFGDGVICVSAEEQEHAGQLGLNPGKLFTVENGLTALPPADRAAARRELGLADDDICLGFVGRLSGQKPVERLVRAFHLLHHQFPQLKIVIVGDGPDFDYVQQLAVSLNVADKVKLTGSADGKFLMAGFDVFVLPSRYEAFPYVFLEALGRALPIIATDVGGVSAVIDEGENGYVVPQERLDLMLGKIAALAEDPQRLHAMSAHSAEKAKRLTVAHMVDQTLGVYRQLLAA